MCLPLALARLVDFPTPLTPQKVMTYGFPPFTFPITSRRMSMRRLGLRICTKDSSMLARTVDWMPLCGHECACVMCVCVLYVMCASFLGLQRLHPSRNGGTAEATLFYHPSRNGGTAEATLYYHPSRNGGTAEATPIPAGMVKQEMRSKRWTTP